MLWQELHGWGEARREKAARLIAQQYIIFPVDEALCREWAKLRSDAQKAGRVIHVADAWIAATALLLGLPLATQRFKDRIFEGMAPVSKGFEEVSNEKPPAV